MGSCLLMLVLLLFRHPVSARMIQIFLVIAAIEWAKTTWLLLDIRQEMAQPWLRMVIILGSVAVFTLVSGLAFLSKPLKNRYFLKMK
ncbi:MAG: hypothetical protein GY869_23160 [Planctomycetes bacterium]|nr:hypothetical protein [Planctomycetota bacterium]